MDHVVMTIPADAGIPVWAIVLAVLGVLIAVVGFLLLDGENLIPAISAFTGLAMAGLATMVIIMANSDHNRHEQAAHPGVDTLAPQFGLTPTGDGMYTDTKGRQYTRCYASNTAVDNTHVSSKLLCAVSGTMTTVRVPK